ncbi:hypothetical protein PM082_018211 [Marasmius tenuissimus]|nr:hypothetical protein PM082_018211 [Marasmius tenuissimus]
MPHFQMFTSSNPAIKHWHFFADNSAAGQDITDTSLRPGQAYCAKVTTCISEFLEADPEQTVEISWVPSHVGIEGNEQADELAKVAIKKGNREPWIGSASNTLQRDKELTLREWKAKWLSSSLHRRFAAAN